MIAHAVADEPLFYDAADCRRYLGLLQLCVERHGWRVFTFVLMRNHLHVLVEAPTRDLSRGLWWLHSNYAVAFLARHPPRRGHVFERRPRTLPLKDDGYFRAVARYIANNPVRAGLCLAPGDYPWSAHRALVGAAPPPPFLAKAELLDWFAGDAGRYEAFVNGTDPAEHADVQIWAKGRPPGRPPLEAILAEGSGDSLRLAHTEWGYSMREIGAALGIHHSTVSARIGRN